MTHPIRILILLLAGSLSACGYWLKAAPPLLGSQQLLEIEIATMHQALLQRRLSCEQLVTYYLERIKRYDQATGLNTMITVNQQALAQAQLLDQHLAQGAVPLSPLFCVPIAVKDNYNTQDLPTTGGSIALKNFYPPTDALQIKRLKAAGAIILAKTNMGEWAFSPNMTLSSVAGETRNAYDLSRVPAGSSGGTASAVAANFALVGLGTDTGNSIRGPASHLALVGLRPTLGLTSQEGIIPLLSNRDVGGPMTRTVTDTARILNVIAADDLAGPITLESRGKAPNYLLHLDKNGLAHARIGVLGDIYDKPDTHPEILQLFEQALQDLKRLGATLINPLDIPDFEILTAAVGFCPRFHHDINAYLKKYQAPIMSIEAIIEQKLYHSASLMALQWGVSDKTSPEKRNPPCVDVMGDPRRKALLEAVVAVMDQHKLDVIVYPTWNHPPRQIGDFDSPTGDNSQIIAPHTGQPAITVPMGYNRQGLPAGLQLLARPYGEAVLIKFAYAYEQATHHRKVPPLFP